MLDEEYSVRITDINRDVGANKVSSFKVSV